MRWRSGRNVRPSLRPNSDWRPRESEQRPPPHPFRESLHLTPPKPPVSKKLVLAFVAGTISFAAVGGLIVFRRATVPRNVAAPTTALPKPLGTPTLRFAGSGSVANKAIAVLATAWAAQLKLSGVHIDRGAEPDTFDVVAGEPKNPFRIEVRTKENDAGLALLLRNQTDFWVTSRPVEDVDIEAAKKAGIPGVPPLIQLRRPGIENQIASAAVVLIVNGGNPVRAMSPEQTLKVFTGKTTAWAQIGGQSNLPIARLGLTAQHEATDWFCALFMTNANTTKCVQSFGLLIKPLMDAPAMLATEIAASPAAIGYAEFGNRGLARPLAFATACGTIIEPSPFRIKAGDYPAVRPLVLYLAPGRPLSRTAKGFLDFAVSPSGQAAIAASGLTDMTPVLANADDHDDRVAQARDAPAFETATDGAERLSITFHFPAGTTAPDGAADADIARLVAWVRQPAYAKQQVLLIGYTEDSENPKLAGERAEALRGRLQVAGLRNATAIGFGSAAPIACDTDPRTAPLNRRVEVWLRTRR